MKCTRHPEREGTFTAIVHNGSAAQAWCLCELCALQVMRNIRGIPEPPDTEPSNPKPEPPQMRASLSLYCPATSKECDSNCVGSVCNRFRDI